MLRDDVCELFSDVDTAAQHMQVLSLKMACDVVGKAAQSLMEARDGAMLAELATVQAFGRPNEHPQHLLDRYYEAMRGKCSRPKLFSPWCCGGRDIPKWQWRTLLLQPM